MQRPDLDKHLGGWQALDATPQEISSHSRTMVVGPASIQVHTYTMYFTSISTNMI